MYIYIILYIKTNKILATPTSLMTTHICKKSRIQKSSGYLLLGDRGKPPISQKFAHSPRTWKNFLTPIPLNKNFHVINQ